MRPASNAGTAADPKTVESMSLKDLKKLQDDPWKINVFHRASEKDTPGIVMEGVSRPLLSAFSPYCKRQLDTGRKSVNVTGGSAAVLKDILRCFNQYCENKNVLPRVGNPELLGYCQVHETAGILEVELLTGWAMVEAELLLERKFVHPANFATVLRKYEVGRYVEMLMDPLARAIANWNGGYSEHCKVSSPSRTSSPTPGPM